MSHIRNYVMHLPPAGPILLAGEYIYKVTSVFADSRIALLCNALRICVAHAPPESCPFSLLVHWAFRACYRNHLPLLHHTWVWHLPATKLICPNVHSVAATLSTSMMLLCCSLASFSFTFRKSLFLSDDRLNPRMYSVGWFLLITMPSGLRFQKRFS